MGSLRIWALAGAAAIMMTPAAHAADLPPIMQQAAPIADDFAGGWYLRGDVGVGMQSFDKFSYVQTNPDFVWPESWNIDSKGINDTVFIGGGIGYQFNSWLRFDITGEYRSTARFKAVGGYTEFCAGGGRCFDVYDGHHSAAVFLANAYLELGTWGGFTPFVGAGVGAGHHRIADFWDLGLNSDGTTGRGFAEDHSKWEMAWAVHAGVAYHVSHNLTIELAYRYLNMGDVKSGVIDCQGCGVINGPLAYYKLKELESHDIKLGLRWMLGAPPPVAAPGLVTKG